MSFELCVINRDNVLTGPRLLSGADLSNVKAITKSAWYVLSGSHKTSKIVLTIRREKVAAWLAAARAAVQNGDRIAMLLNGKTIGVLIWTSPPNGNEVEIDAAFFSSGDEQAKADAAKDLAKQIRGSVR